MLNEKGSKKNYTYSSRDPDSGYVENVYFDRIVEETALIILDTSSEFKVPNQSHLNAKFDR